MGVTVAPVPRLLRISWGELMGKGGSNQPAIYLWRSAGSEVKSEWKVKARKATVRRMEWLVCIDRVVLVGVVQHAGVW